MAIRTISTRLAIKGETEYRASLTRVNGELRTLQSALKLTQSQYKNNANSLEALTAKGNALNALHEKQQKKLEEIRKGIENAREAESNWAAEKQRLEEQIKANNQALEELKNTTGDTAEEQERLTAENRRLDTELASAEAHLIAASRGVDNWQSYLNNAQIALNELSAEIEQNNEYLSEAENSADGCATSIDRFGNRVESSADQADTLRDALMAAGVVEALKKTAEALKACVDESIEFESAMAGVSKTTDMTGAELAAMGKEIQELATRIPATADEIANVAEAAGQLGIAKEDLLSFSETMVNLGVATNLTSTEAASALAKFANVVNMSADNYERLGSVIVGLGNNFATTEADIVSMATRLASSGAIVGLTEAEIMAVATALSSVGIEAEAGGSAVSKLLKQFETMVQTGSPALNDFAAVAGMTADEFSAAWGENAVGALSKFIDGLSAVDKAGGSSVAVLDDLGITEVRLSNAVLAMASSNGILEKALNTANTAWEENSALAKEAATRYETTESKLQLLSNAADNVKTAVGDDLTPALGNLADTGADVLNWCADFIDQNEAVVPLLTATATTIGVLAAGITGYVVVTKLASAATAAFTATLNTNPIFLAATAIAALVGGIGVLATTIDDDGVPAVKDLTTAAQDCAAAFEESESAYHDTAAEIEGAAALAHTYFERLSELEAQGINTNAAQTEYSIIVDKLNSTIPDLNLQIDEQTGMLVESKEAILGKVDAWKQLALQEALTTKYTDQIEAWGAAELEVYENQVKLNTAVAEGNTLQGQYNDLVEKAKDVGQKIADVYDDTTLSAEEQTKALDKLEREQADLDTQIRSVSREMETNEKMQRNLTTAIEDGNKVVKENEQVVNQAKAALDTFNNSLEESGDIAGESQEALAGVQTELEELATAYSETYESAYSSINGQIGLFDTFAKSVSKDTDTVEEMIARWGEATQNLASYTENLQKAAKYGIDDGLVLSLSDGSAESAGYLATITEKIEKVGETTEGLDTDAQKFVEEINGAYRERESALEDFSTTVAALGTDFALAVDEIEKAANEADFSGVTTALESAFAQVDIDTQAVGKNVADGIETGIVGESDRITNTTTNTVKRATNSVSNNIEKDGTANNIGKNVVSGIESGVNEQSPTLMRTVEDVGTDIEEIVTESAAASVKNFTDEYSKISAKTKSIMDNLRGVVAREGLALSDGAYSVGQQTVNGMIRGMNNRAGSLYSTVSNIVENSIARAKKAAATASPSKKTTKIFEDVGEGMVVGLENKRQRIADHTQSIVDQALKIDTRSLVATARATIDDRMPVLDLRENANAQHAFTNAVVQTLTKKASEGGNVYVSINSPQALDEKTAAREFKKVQRDISLGIA